MTTSLPDSRKTPYERRVARRWLWEFGGGLALYILLVFVRGHLLSDAVALPHPLRWGAALLPVLGILLCVVAAMRGIGRFDEYVRRNQFHAISFAFAGTAVITMALAFLEEAGGPRVSMVWVWPIMGALWFSALAFLVVRERAGRSGREVPPR